MDSRGESERKKGQSSFLARATQVGLVISLSITGGELSLIASFLDKNFPFGTQENAVSWYGSLGLEVAGGLIATAIASFLAGYLIRGERFRRRYEAAPTAFTNQISAAINMASQQLSAESAISANEALVYARIIVSTRDNLRNSLTSVSRLLNSEIDRLSASVEQAEALRGREGVIPPGAFRQLFENIQVLKGVWESRASQIEIEIRKLQTELGLVED